MGSGSKSPRRSSLEVEVGVGRPERPSDGLGFSWLAVPEDFEGTDAGVTPRQSMFAFQIGVRPKRAGASHERPFILCAMLLALDSLPTHTHTHTHTITTSAKRVYACA
ncbi:hypothetical protein EYF80_066020 [Liparis tanakae]|uniref:Uncharacterized protein n=1 Tax=Liparis tanakae TaxID=230148 RepID=A0A4Z2E4Z9_9TELE|nr:hypothetical protein EYF80_066020 [Liparis tanakae]